MLLCAYKVNFVLMYRWIEKTDTRLQCVVLLGWSRLQIDDLVLYLQQTLGGFLQYKALLYSIHEWKKEKKEYLITLHAQRKGPRLLNNSMDSTYF